MGEPPPPFDTESRVEHTDVDVARMEDLKQPTGQEPERGATRGEEPLSARDPEPGATQGRGNRRSGRRDDGHGV